MATLRFAEAWLEAVRGLRARLRGEEVVTGVFVAFPEPRLMDMWAMGGVSFVIIDLEHATLSMDQADRLCEAAVHAGLAPLVRAAPDDRQAMLRCLDAGAAGLVIPDVRSATEVRRWVEVISYPPTGTRGLSQVRANGWNTVGTSDDPERRPLLVPMIESLEAIAEADGLFAVEEADWYHVGLVDLGMRLRGKPGSPDAAQLLTDLGRSAKAAGKPIGANQTVSPAIQAPPAGVRIIATPDRALALGGARLFVQGSSK